MNNKDKPKLTRTGPSIIVGNVTMSYDFKGRFTIPREMCPETDYYFQRGQEISLEVYPSSRFTAIAEAVMLMGKYSPERREFLTETDFARKDKLNRVLTPKRMRAVLGFDEGETGLVRLTGNGNHILVTKVKPAESH